MFLPTADLWTRLNRNYARLEETKYYPYNVYQRAKEHEKWPGDTEGRTLLAWILLARATGRPPRHLAEMLALWPSEINARGYFGNIYTDGISEQQLSSHGWVLQALAELHRAAEAGHAWATPHDARALALPIIENLFLPTAHAYANYPIDPAERETAGSYSGSHQKQIGPWILSTDVGCFTIGMTGLIDAAEAFGLTDLSLSKGLAPLIEAMIARFLAIDLKAIKAQTHATLTALRGLARWSRLTANPALWSEIANRYQLYTDFAWTETYANFNWFDRPRWTEPCSMVDSLIVAMELWRHTGDDHFLEHAQLIWFNALGHGFRTNGGYGCDSCPGADGETDLMFSTQESHWCCTMRGAEGLYRMCAYQVIENPDPSTGSGQAGSLTLPFGLPGDYTSADASLRIESNYPHAATWKLTNTGSTPLTVRLFIPSWIEGLPAADCWLSATLAPGASHSVEGQLVTRERPCLSATTAFNPAFPAGTIRMNGPLVLARYGEGEDAWKPIFEDYLRGDMTKPHSAKKLICIIPHHPPKLRNSATPNSTLMNTSPVLDYIRANWTRSFYRDANGSGFKGDDLPFPYTSPCIKGEGKFSFFFYWDTYFTNLGLLAHGHADMARDNIKNMLWLIKRQGYMPNHVALFNRSQSPYLCRMVTEYFDHLSSLGQSDDAFLEACADGLRQEYHFWTVARHTPIGLSAYGHHETTEGCIEFYNKSLLRRLPFLDKDAPAATKARIGGHYMANAEATCDFSNRFDQRCLDFCQVDLNALLYEYETVLAGYSKQFGWGDTQLWIERQTIRKARMNQYFWSEQEGLFFDYDFVNHQHSKVPAQTGYQTLFAGMASPEQAARMVENLPLFEREHGMAYTPDVPGCRDYQWAYPNVWPSMVWMLVDGLNRYGYKTEAGRLARKYVATTDRLFAKTGQLWEKTDAETGDVAGGEYDAAAMMGWSAGVYVACHDYLAGIAGIEVP